MFSDAELDVGTGKTAPGRVSESGPQIARLFIDGVPQLGG